LRDDDDDDDHNPMEESSSMFDASIRVMLDLDRGRNAVRSGLGAQAHFERP
jgi:hypothetical protein